MDAGLIYWSGALLNMAVLVLLAVRGFRHIRRGDVDAHRRAMVTAGALIAAFLVSFVLKSLFLGFEDYSHWSQFAILNLRIHESFVAVMLLGGSCALTLGFRMRSSRNVTGDPQALPAPASVVSWHKRAGRAAIVTSFLGLLTAALVLLGMIGRAAA